ncbi:MAG: ABC transporter permease [Clostridia bacterium]|nr:ABC transporter permease [Clostridia bacterium]NLF20708.1 ABC transporter permease [Clostridiaceae bacterium]
MQQATTAPGLDRSLAERISHETYYQTVFRRFRRHRPGFISLIFLGLMLLLIAVTPLLSPYGPNQITSAFSAMPSAEHWLGTDQVGRDMLTRLMTGSGISLFVALLATVVSTLLGVLLGLAAGYFGGWIDIIIMRVTDIVMSFPYLLLVLVAAAIFGPGMWNIVLILGFVNWPGMARLVRSNVMSLRGVNYVQGSQVAGMPTIYILFKEILPNTIAPVLIYATSVMAQTMLDEAALSFLGMGVQAPTASLGNLLNVAQSYTILETKPWMWLPPGLMTILLVVAVNFIGDALRDAFDPRNLQ